MENKQWPEQEPEKLSENAAVPVPEAEDEVLIIEDLSFSDTTVTEEIPSLEEIPSVPEAVCAAQEEPAAENISDAENIPDSEALSRVEEIPPEEHFADDLLQEPVGTIFPEEEPSYVAGDPLMPETEPGALMEWSPEAEELPAPAEALSDLPAPPELTADDLAMDFHGMVSHEELIPDPALEILNDPQFQAPVPPQPPAEDVNDQEYRDNVPQPQPEVSAPAAGKKKAADQRPTLKGRPKRKKGEGLFGIPNILATFVWMALILAIGVTLGRMLWVCAADVLAFGREDKKVTITVYEADTMEDVIDKLHDAGLIRYKSLFTLYANISDAEEDIQPGIYDLNTRYDYHALVNFMSPSSTREVVELTIPEGYTCRQIYSLLEENRVCTSVDIASYAADGELSDYWFLENVERGSEYCLEGFLFPDTYQFYKNSTPREALEKMLDNFDYRFSEEMRTQIDALNANVTGGGYGVREVVIVASLIEKESAAPAESATIASVIYNRLYNWDYPALLNIDAAIVYAQGGEADTIDTGIDSPYNTYRYTGLTPTPIANPGLSSLNAALNPETSDYYFYVLNPDTGTHQFSTTQTEHDAWIAEFYN